MSIAAKRPRWDLMVTAALALALAIGAGVAGANVQRRLDEAAIAAFKAALEKRVDDEMAPLVEDLQRLALFREEICGDIVAGRAIRFLQERRERSGDWVVFVC